MSKPKQARGAPLPRGESLPDADVPSLNPVLAEPDAPNRPPADPAAYDAWFRAEVEQALREADDPNTQWISNEEVERESAQWIEQIIEKFQKQGA